MFYQEPVACLTPILENKSEDFLLCISTACRYPPFKFVLLEHHATDIHGIHCFDRDRLS